MTELHRENQVANAIAERLTDDLVGQARVFTHRRRTLAQEVGDVPALSVDLGTDDESNDGEQTFDGFLMDAELRITILVLARSEPELIERLGTLRREIHLAMRRRPRSLGETWIVSAMPTRAEEPEVSVDNELIIGVRTYRWLVRYAHSTDDPAT